MTYSQQNLTYLYKHLKEASKCLPKKPLEILAFSEVVQARQNLEKVISLLNQKNLVINNIRIKNLVKPTLTSLTEYQRTVAADKIVSHKSRKVLADRNNTQIKQARKLLKERIKEQREPSPKKQEEISPKEYFDRITSFEQLAEIFEKNKNTKKAEAAADVKVLTEKLPTLVKYEKDRKKIPAQIKNRHKFEIRELPIMVILENRADLSAIRRLGIEYKFFGTALILEDQKVIMWNPKAKLSSDEIEEYGSIPEKAIRIVSIKENEKLIPVATTKGKLTFKTPGSKFEFAWLIGRSIVNLSLKIADFGFPFTKRGVTQKIDIREVEKEILEQANPDLYKRLKHYQQQFESIDKIIQLFDRHGNIKNKEEVPKDISPAFYDEYLQQHKKIKTRLEKAQEEFKKEIRKYNIG